MLVRIFFGGFGRRVYLPEKKSERMEYLKWWALEKVTPFVDANLGEFRISILGFACLMLRKSSKHIFPNGGEKKLGDLP